MAQLQDLIVNGNTRFINTSYATTPATGDNSTKIATTAFVTTAIYNALHPSSTIEEDTNNNQPSKKEN